jgi:hypothetical protein
MKTTRFDQALVNKDFNTIKQMIEKGEIGDNEFYEICSHDHIEIVKFIFDNNITGNFNKNLLLRHTCATTGLEQLKWVIDNGHYPLKYHDITQSVEEYGYCAHLRDVEKMDYLYSRGFTNIGGFVFENSLNTPNNVEVLEWLKNHGYKFDDYLKLSNLISHASEFNDPNNLLWLIKNNFIDHREISQMFNR